jgi:hypothetical protein
MVKMWQAWHVRLYWTSGRSNYERGRSSCWPVGTSPMDVIRDVASDPDNGCDITICTSIECRAVDEPFELDVQPPAPRR